MSLLTALPVAAASVFRAAPVEWPLLVVQLLSFTPWMTVPAAAAALLAFPARSRLLQVLTVALLAAQVFWLLPTDVNRPVAGPPGHGTARLVAMNINAELGGADPVEIVRLVGENHVDLLTVQEYSQALGDGLARAGLGALLPNRVSHPRDGAAGAAVYSSFTLKEIGLVAGTTFSMPVVRLDLVDATGSTATASTALTVVNVHTHAPVEGALAQWRSELASVTRTSDVAAPLLLAGDFNATYDHREFRGLLDGGGKAGKLVDVATALGSRLVPTWPMRDYQLPGVTLDHLVTSRDITGSGYSVHQVSGTDHAAVIAALEIQLP